MLSTIRSIPSRRIGAIRSIPSRRIGAIRSIPSQRICATRRALAHLTLLAVLTVSFACGDEEGEAGGAGGTPLSANVPAVTAGAWYRPGVEATWAWQIQGTINDGYDVEIYDVDLFDTSAGQIAALQGQGRRVLCYFSAGSWEDFRDDAGDFPASVRGNTLSGFPDERWLDIRSRSVFDLMLARLDLALSKGCDGVEPDNVTGHANSTGFALTPTDQLAFNRNLFNAAHERGLAVALKNDLDQVAELIDYVDLSVNEQCHEFDECAVLQAFIDAGKPVLNAEYLAAFRTAPESVCRRALIGNIRTLLLDEELDDSFRVSCDDDFPSTTRLTGVQTYVTYYQQDAARLAELTELDLAIVQPVLTEDQIRSLQSHGRVAVYLSIGEIGLSNTYLYQGEIVLGQVVFDDHPEWFIAKNPFFDSWFADTREPGWQQFVVEQAGLLLAQGYDGLFMDTVDTVDVYPETIPGMVGLIAALRDAYPDIVLVQNRGINVIPQTGPDVDALMFEVFNSYFDFGAMDYQTTDVAQVGYPELVEKAVDYRLAGGVVLSQDFALPEPAYEDLVCYARDRALRHRFVPSYADKFFQDGLFEYPAACPWPSEPGYEVAFDAQVANVSKGSTSLITVSVEGRLGYGEPVTLALGATPAGLAAALGDTVLLPGESTTLVVTAAPSAAAEAGELEIQASSAAGDESYTLALVVHDETAWIANAGLSHVVAFDEPDTLVSPALASRRSGPVIAQPYAIAIDGEGATWVVENVGDPAAPQPAGRALRFAPFDLSEPEAVFDTGLNYPTGIAIAPDGRVWIANSALDFTGTPRGAISIATVAPGGADVDGGFGYAPSTYGFPRKIALDAAGRLWVTTSYGLVLGFASPTAASGVTAPFAVVVGVTGPGGDFLDTAYDLDFDADGDLWISGKLAGGSRVIEVKSGAWKEDGTPTYLASADVATVLDDGLFEPWDLDFGASGDLWIVNGTDAIDDAQSRGSLVRFDAGSLTTGASPDAVIDLDSRYTLGLAIARP